MCIKDLTLKTTYRSHAAAPMDDIYLIEIRLARTHWKIKETISSLADFFGVTDLMERHPHVTLFGPFRLLPGIPPEEILHQIAQCAAPHDTLPFTIYDWERRDGLRGGVVAFSVSPSDALRQVTWEIADAFAQISVSYNHWDSQPDKKWFHVTVANWLARKKADEIYAALEQYSHWHPSYPASFQNLITRIAALLEIYPKLLPPSARRLWLDETGLRITVMHGQEIFAEYDLLTRTWITGATLHDPAAWQHTVAHYRQHAGFELPPRVPDTTGEIYLISDMHLGHANIIRYCSRPFVFSDVGEMDQVLIQNWNSTISPHDAVYYLGDLRYGRNAQTAEHYRDQLNGNITFVTGNHDKKESFAVPTVELEYANLRFLLVHDPADVPPAFDGWVIHGHHHNNDLRHYPFIHFTNRRINVSAEVLGYCPVGMGELARIIHEHKCSSDREPILLRYPYIW
ncbi:MAG: hypothetical protein STSR0009_12610 [Methanoregula sp.]